MVLWVTSCSPPNTSTVPGSYSWSDLYISAKSAYCAELERPHRLENLLPVALQGRVPCRVKGPIEKGQQVVSSNIPGTAEAFDESKHNNGCVIGKALVDYPMTDEAIIEVVVGRI